MSKPRIHTRIIQHSFAAGLQGALLEGLSAEAALARVRKTHPWARPDSRHWLKLRWLGRNS